MLAAAPAAGAPDPASEQEIVVIGRKLATWRGVWRSRKGVVSCKTTRSSGDKAIDALGCNALVACATPLVPRIKAIAAAKLAKADREMQMNAVAGSIDPCLTQLREAGIAALAATRVRR